jgi:hypothetical protein
MANDPLWQGFIQHCAVSLLAGELTTAYLRGAAKDPRLVDSAMSNDFRDALAKACAEISPLAAKWRSVELEIRAADRRFRELLAQRQQATPKRTSDQVLVPR